MIYTHLLISTPANAALACVDKSVDTAPTSAEVVPLMQGYYPPTAKCWEYSMPVYLPSVEVTTFAFLEWSDDYQLQDFLTAATARVSANFPSVVNGTMEYTISASFCTPKTTTPRKRTIILATHRIGLPCSHWNSTYEDKYNFVQYAIDKGYSVWLYDRLGTGFSETLDNLVSGFTTQLRLQKSILVELADIVKSGKYNGNFGKPDKLAVMDFSFGSHVTHFPVAENPTLADAAIHGGFTGAALAITGETDYVICDGECKVIFKEPARTIWKNAKFSPYLHRGASHNFNFHFNATGAYGVIASFLDANSLLDFVLVYIFILKA